MALLLSYVESQHSLLAVYGFIASSVASLSSCVERATPPASLCMGFIERIPGNLDYRVHRFCGLCLSGPPKGTQLKPLILIPEFWFAWSQFRPGTRLFTANPKKPSASKN